MIRRIGLLTILLVAWVAPAWAMEHYTNSLQDEKGNGIGHATVHVYETGTTTHVTIYSDNGTTTKANPFSTNNTDGTYDFYAANGVYDLVFSKAGVTFVNARTARISLFDVNDGGGGGSGDLTIGSTPVIGGAASSFLYVGTGPTLAQVSLAGMVVGNGASAPTAFPGVTCINQVLRVLSSTGSGTCATITSSFVDTSVWTGTATSGLLKASSQGVLVTATAGTDYTTPTSTETPTNKTINCEGPGNSCTNVSLTTSVIGILQGANGGTANGFMDFTGPATSLKTFTLPNASATILTTDALVTLAQGGTANATWTPTTCVRVNAGGTALESTGTDCGPGGVGAPTDATYWTGAAHGDLSAEINLGALGTGLVINTAGTPSIYAGVTCTNQVLRLLSASGAGTCVTLTSAYVDTTIWTGTVAAGILKATSQGVLAAATAGTDYVDVATSNSWSDGVKQTFNPNGTNAGINVGANAGDPSALANADIWYNSSTDKLRCRQGGSTFDCVTTAVVSSVAASGGTETTTGSPITSTGTIRGAVLVNAQTGTTYTILTGDRGGLVTFTNASPIAVTLPQAGGTFPTGWYTDLQNRGAGLLTVTPTTSTIDGSASLTLNTGAGMRIVSDGTNYFTQRGRAGTPGFDALTSGSNTTATMTCGAGCSVVPSSTGIVAATSIRPTAVTVNLGNSPYPALVTDRLILCDTAGGARIVTLPAATVKVSYMIKNLGVNTCTINRAGADLIDGGTSAVLTVQYESIGLDSDGTATWEIF